MGRAYWKTVFSTVKDNLGRFFAITGIIALGITFISGLGTLSKKMEDTLSADMQAQNVADIIVKGTTEAGIGAKQLEAIAASEGVESVLPFTMMDLKSGETNTRIYLLPTDRTDGPNRLQLIAGEYPKNLMTADGEVEALAERSSAVMPNYTVGQTVQVNAMGFDLKVKITGIVGNPLITFRGGEPDQVTQENLQLILYFDSELVKGALSGMGIELPVTDVYVKCKDTATLNLFSQEYKTSVRKVKDALVAALNTDEILCLTLNENASYIVTESYSKKIDVITMIFPVFFIAVSALVVLTTVTRMTEEERGMIGCYKTLGYGNGKVAFKYIGFSLLCCLLGCGVGILLGLTLMPAAIFPSFHSILFLNGAEKGIDPVAGIIASACMIAVVAGVTAYLVANELRGQPAELLKPKAPKAGKKIWMEYIPFLWNPLPFRYKSTVRNLFRYKRHLIMTVISVAGSSALVLAGFGLHDVWSNPDAYLFGAGMEKAFTAISVVVILFAVALCVLVIYNLTNMNIGERKREIATLKVLGYRDAEVAGYIFREIFIMALFGIAVGLPVGYFLLKFVFAYLEFGKVSDVYWYSYLLSVAVVIGTVGLVDLMLMRKLKGVDMTASLKTVE